VDSSRVVQNPSRNGAHGVVHGEICEMSLNLFRHVAKPVKLFLKLVGALSPLFVGFPNATDERV
jgi:hypothetical protein